MDSEIPKNCTFWGVGCLAVIRRRLKVTFQMSHLSFLELGTWPRILVHAQQRKARWNHWSESALPPKYADSNRRSTKRRGKTAALVIASRQYAAGLIQPRTTSLTRCRGSREATRVVRSNHTQGRAHTVNAYIVAANAQIKKTGAWVATVMPYRMQGSATPRDFSNKLRQAQPKNLCDSKANRCQRTCHPKVFNCNSQLAKRSVLAKSTDSRPKSCSIPAVYLVGRMDAYPNSQVRDCPLGC